ncbi:uncharacterized protein F5891DRAFT_1273772 [Suillus fuscotomentosus]|uniref:Uncharacterized protein n=1 Tax=Suillus fuscotomentosus TaxID=1912939 RepID=A0AAD4HSE0_9AGAM|nr:uncharacterized protein F5891DRAFT_1273772 [Suillus fuscotomentosus]KAG1906836.1 hypothetical protein F5891DRAFT_1273772 [Suillus fuscotomentosus]
MEVIEWARQAEVCEHESALEAHVMTQSSFTSQCEAATAFCDARSLPVDAASCAIRARSSSSLRVNACAAPSLSQCQETLHHVPLPSIALAELKILKDSFIRAIRHSSRMNPGESRTDLIVLLRKLWGLDHATHRRRTGARSQTKAPLSNLAVDRSGKEPCLEDLYICSYTPTLSALIRSRQLMKKRMPPSFVAIGQGQTGHGAGKGKALLAVDSELELVHKLVPATANRTTISGGAATQAGALSVLQ